MNKFEAILFAAIMIVILPIAQAQILPSETDLKAAYCLGLHNAILRLPGDFEAELDKLPMSPEDRTKSKKHYQNWKAEHLRLQRYLFPRLEFLEATGIFFAMKSGENDLTEGAKELQACSSPCSEKYKTTNDIVNCFLACGKDSPAGRRMENCNDLSWLPY